MDVDFAIEVWQAMVALYAHLVVKQLNAEEGLRFYYSAIPVDMDDHEFLLFHKSVDGQHKTHHQQVVRVTLLQEWVEGEDLRDLHVTLAFATTSSTVKRLVTKVITQVLADLVAVNAFVSVKYKGKVLRPQDVPDPF